VNERQGGVHFDLLNITIHTKFHKCVDYSIRDEVVKQLLVVGQQRDGKDCIRSHLGWELGVKHLENELQKVERLNLGNHVEVKADEGSHPAEFL
jgi:hypothetical protein